MTNKQEPKNELTDIPNAAVIALQAEIKSDVIRKSLMLKSVKQNLQLVLPTIEAALLCYENNKSSPQKMTLENFEMSLLTPQGVVFILHSSTIEKREFYVIN